MNMEPYIIAAQEILSTGILVRREFLPSLLPIAQLQNHSRILMVLHSPLMFPIVIRIPVQKMKFFMRF